MKRRLVTAVALGILGASVRGAAASAKDDDQEEKLQAAAVQDATVNFGQAQKQTPDPAPVGAVVTHFLDPDDVTIHKGGSVTFVVNGGGHRILVYPLRQKTTPRDGSEGLCDGAQHA